jgi:hypothetical protein
MKSSYLSLILFLPSSQLFCQLPPPETLSVQFLCSQAHIVARWRLETQLTQMIFFVLFIPSRHGARRKHGLSIVEKACLRSRCIAVEVIRFLLAYLLPRECVYQVVAQQWMSPLVSLFRLSGVMSQHSLH